MDQFEEGVRKSATMAEDLKKALKNPEFHRAVNNHLMETNRLFQWVMDQSKKKEGKNGR